MANIYEYTEKAVQQDGETGEDSVLHLGGYGDTCIVDRYEREKKDSHAW